MNSEIYSIYDEINTMAVKWLTYNSKVHNYKLCIDFKNDSYHYWFLHILENFRVFNNYVTYYVDCGLIRYFIIRYIKKFKGARWHRKQKTFSIDVKNFINELINHFSIFNAIENDPKIIERIYNAYWKGGD